jgi:hypothetical protein
MDGSTLPRLFCALGVIALLLWALSAVLRYEPFARLAGSGRRRLIDPVETTALANGAFLHVVKILDRYYVLGSSSGAVSVLCPIAKDDVEARLRGNKARPSVAAGDRT